MPARPTRGEAARRPAAPEQLAQANCEDKPQAEPGGEATPRAGRTDGKKPRRGRRARTRALRARGWKQSEPRSEAQGRGTSRRATLARRRSGEHSGRRLICRARRTPSSEPFIASDREAAQASWRLAHSTPRKWRAGDTEQSEDLARAVTHCSRRLRRVTDWTICRRGSVATASYRRRWAFGIATAGNQKGLPF